MSDLSRRDFLKQAAVIGSVALAGIKLTHSSKNGSPLQKNWHLNPAFQIADTPGHSLELYCFDGRGHRIAHAFSGLEADLLVAIEKKQSLEEHIPLLAGKHHCSEKQCRNRMIALLSDQEKAKIVYSGKEMLVFKREIHG